MPKVEPRLGHLEQGEVTHADVQSVKTLNVTTCINGKGGGEGKMELT